MHVTFCGAAETVTGSCHLIEASGKRILVDCGMFQGERSLRQRNREPFPFEPSSIDCLVLSHAHLDHCGLVPKLVRDGFRGEILCTPPTAEIARVILADSAHIQVEDAAYRARKARRRGERAEPPIYDMGDVLDAVSLFGRQPGYAEVTRIAGEVDLVLHDAGHILGSSIVELRAEGKTLVFSGDLGNLHQPIVQDPSSPPAADAVLIESTYGDRRHKTIEDSVGELREAIQTVIGRGGNLLIPSFALERTQEVLYEIFLMWRKRELPACAIYLDSPLAIATTRIFARYPDWFDAEGQALFATDPNPFSFPPLRFSQTTDESKRINAKSGGAVIIAGSGMCSGGRIIHHLRHNLWNDRCGIVFVGYQAAGTLGRRIVDGADRVNVFGEEVSVRASVWTVNGFSSHADQPILVDWLRRAGAPKVFLVHGELSGLQGLASRVKQDLGLDARIARWKETVEI